MGIVWYGMGRKRRCADTLTVVREYQPFCLYGKSRQGIDLILKSLHLSTCKLLYGE